MNTKKVLLEAKQGGVEMNLFYFDPIIIDWEDYFLNIHIPGIFKYALK
jgi:fatty acyl-CoA reductase